MKRNIHVFMVISDNSWARQAVLILIIFTIVSGTFFWIIGVNPLQYLPGAQYLGQVTAPTTTTTNVPTTPFLQQMLGILGEHQGTVNNDQALQRFETTRKLLQSLIGQL